MATKLKKTPEGYQFGDIVITQSDYNNLLAKVYQDVASNLKTQVSQPTPEDLKALVTLAGLRGIIPNPITAPRIMESNRAKNETKILYTVPANKILFISSAWGNVASDYTDIQDVEVLYWRDGGDINNKHLFRMFVHENAHLILSDSYWPAKEVLAGYDVCSKSARDQVLVRSGFSGWLEDA